MGRGEVVRLLRQCGLHNQNGKASEWLNLQHTNTNADIRGDVLIETPSPILNLSSPVCYGLNHDFEFRSPDLDLVVG